MKGELDAIFTVIMIEMKPAFRQKILNKYKSDFN